MHNAARSTPNSNIWLRYIRIARPDHWIKNVFIIPGIVLAFMVGAPLGGVIFIKCIFGFLASCFLSSANYTLNEFLDAETDKFHPTKKERPGAEGLLNGSLVGFEYLICAALGLFLSCCVGIAFFITALLFLIVSIFYNVSPFRFKDRAYLDVLCESINSPLRLLMGWYSVTYEGFPPSSALLAYWMGGAFLMVIKRYSEYRFINNVTLAASYRRSFKTYKEDTLLLSSFFYGLNATFFLGIFLIKYRIEYFITLPFIAFMFVWYMAIALRKDSAAQAPEKLYKERRFLAYTIFLWLLLIIMTFIDVPQLHGLIAPTHYGNN